VRAALALAALAACSAPASAPRPTPKPNPRLTWESLAVNGANWERKVASIPPLDRERLATELLETPKTCPARATKVDCETTLTFDGFLPSADLTDPCLWRAVALWAVQQVDPRTLEVQLGPQALSLMSLPEPEHELNVAVFDNVITSKDSSVRADALAALATSGASEKAVEYATKLSADDADVDENVALACHGVDRAMNNLIDRGLDADVLKRMNEAENCDVGWLGNETKVRLMSALWKIRKTKGYQDVFMQLFEDGNCEVLNAIDRIDEERLFRLLPWHQRACITLLRNEDIRALVAPGKLTIVYDLVDLRDATQNVHSIDHVANDDKFTLPFQDELQLAFPGCKDDTACQVPGRQVTFALRVDKKGQLVAIERSQVVGGCL
jgi:hypothetical protein